MKPRHLVLPLATLLLLPSDPADAQSGGRRIDVIPSVGLFAPQSDLGRVRVDGEDLPLRQRSALAAGVAVEFPLSAEWLSLRGTAGLAPASDIAYLRHVGEESCGHQCYRTIYDDVRITDSRILILTAGALARLPRLAGVQPYAIGGAGIKHHSFSRQQLPSGFENVFDGGRSTVSVHAGAGAEIPLGPVALRAEVADHLSRYRLTNAASPHANLQHDVSAQIGFRVRR
jgi:hypothetical protein